MTARQVNCFASRSCGNLIGLVMQLLGFSTLIGYWERTDSASCRLGVRVSHRRFLLPDIIHCVPSRAVTHLEHSPMPPLIRRAPEQARATSHLLRGMMSLIAAETNLDPRRNSAQGTLVGRTSTGKGPMPL